MTVLGHVLLLVYLASKLEAGMAGAGHDQSGSMDSMEVTFITLPETISNLHGSFETVAPSTSGGFEISAHRALSDQSDEATKKSFIERRQQSVLAILAMKAGQGTKPSEDLRGQYEAAIREVIERKWRQLVQSPFPANCTLHFTQLAGGAVTSAVTGDCDLPNEERARLEAAVLMAQPLPYEGYESVFAMEIKMKF